MSLDREVGGLTCRQVLERLSDYLDDELERPARAQVEEHLRGCEQCLRFGGAIGGMVAAVRGQADAEQPAAVAGRLAAQLAVVDREPDR